MQDSTSFSGYRSSNALQGPQSDRISAMKHAFAVSNSDDKGNIHYENYVPMQCTEIFLR